MNNKKTKKNVTYVPRDIRDSDINNLKNGYFLWLSIEILYSLKISRLNEKKSHFFVSSLIITLLTIL